MRSRYFRRSIVAKAGSLTRLWSRSILDLGRLRIVAPHLVVGHESEFGRTWMKQRLKVRVTRIRRRRVSVPAVILHAPCGTCQREVETLPRFQAAQILEVEEQALDALILAGHVHAFVTVSGSLLICRDSLFAKTD